MPSIKIVLTSGSYDSVMTINNAILPGPFNSEWSCVPPDAFSEPSGKAANLLGDSDLSIIGSGARTLGKLLDFKGNSSGTGEAYDDGRLSGSFNWERS